MLQDNNIFLRNCRHWDVRLMSGFVQNIVDMIVDFALGVAVLKKFSKIVEGLGLKAISKGADEVYFVLSWSERIPFRLVTCRWTS